MMLALKNILFTLVVPGTVGVYLPLILARGRNAATDFLLGLAVIFFVIGGSIYSWCVFDFASFGRGTPAPIDAPKKLVVRGLYRYTRNPMYVGVLTVILGWALLFRALELVLYALVVGACFQTFIVWYEEPHLRAIFASEYQRYCARVGRWLPRVR